VAALANLPALMIPNYNSLPFDLGFVGLSCWIAGARSGTPSGPLVWGTLGGGFLGLSCLCYLPR
jgi:hypothetical protein